MSKKLFIIFTFLLSLTNFVNAQENLLIYKSRIEQYKYSKHFDSTKFYFKKALPIALKNKDSLSVFYIYKSMGDAFEHHLFRDSTLLMYDFCEKFIPKKNTKLKSFLLNDRGYTYDLLHDYETATQLRLKALKIAEKSGNKDQIANVMINLADDLSKLNLNKEAEQYYKKAIEISKLTKRVELIEYSHRYYGSHLLKKGENDLAFFNLKLASKYALQTNDSITMAFAWSKLSECYWNNKKVDSSFIYAKKAEGIWERRAENIDLSEICMQQGKYYIILKDYKKAEFYLKKAEKYILSDLYFNEKLFSNFADLYINQGKSKLAFDYLLKAKKTIEKIKDNENKSKVASLNIKFESDKKEILLKEEKQISELANLKTQQRSYQLKIAALVVFISLISLTIIVFALIKIRKSNKLLFDANKNLENLVGQKKILLKEIHHRVKNNLTTLKSLLFLQAKATSSEEAKLVLKECQLRIQSMALIHQSLYEDIENDDVDFDKFLQQLLESLEASFKIDDKNIRINIKKNDVVLDVSIAVFLGLILNELVTNSYKYAFANQNEGEINIKLSNNNDQFVLIYSDNGCGLPNGFDENNGGFGFKIIRILVQQIKGNLVYEYQNNLSTFTINTINVK